MPSEMHKDWYESAQLRREVADLTALLCEVARAWPTKATMPETLRTWYRAHKEQDRARVEQARAQRLVTIARLERDRQQIDEELAALRRT
jgi:hypothetical protein